jgi:hypothetical protein
MTMSASSGKAMQCQVRVGVRVRPLTSQELGQGGKSVLKVIPPEIRLGERRFTYDAVFDERVDQNELYSQVSKPLLNSFLEGYNATVSDAFVALSGARVVLWVRQTYPSASSPLLTLRLWLTDKLAAER